MIPLTILSLLAIAQAPTDSIDADQFVRIMSQAYADVADVSFVFEGVGLPIPKGQTWDTVKSNPVVDWREKFQGGYSFRSDGATRLDCFSSTHRDGEEKEVHRLAVILDHKQTELDRYPTIRNEQPTTRGGGPGTLNRPASPERIVYHWYFQTLTDARWRGYQYLGWEEVDGRRCLKVQFDEVWSLNDTSPDRKVVQFWIDLERGAHPLRVEFRDGAGVRMRAVGIQLAEIDDGKGGSRWFPVHGRFESFGSPGMTSYLDSAFRVEEQQVVAGTVKFNQSLSDKFFTIDWKGPFVETPQLAETRTTFRKPTPRYDPVSIRERLVETLEKADRQTEEWDASPVDPQTGSRLARTVLIAMGGAVLIAVVVLRIRRIS